MVITVRIPFVVTDKLKQLKYAMLNIMLFLNIIFAVTAHLSRLSSTT